MVKAEVRNNYQRGGAFCGSKLNVVPRCRSDWTVNRERQNTGHRRCTSVNSPARSVGRAKGCSRTLAPGRPDCCVDRRGAGHLEWITMTGKQLSPLCLARNRQSRAAPIVPLCPRLLQRAAPLSALGSCCAGRHTHPLVPPAATHPSPSLPEIAHDP